MSPVFPKSLSSPPSPIPLSPTLGGKGGATHLKMQGYHCLPGSPLSSWYPCPDDAGHTIRDLNPIPQSNPFTPVINPKLGSQDGSLFCSGEESQNGCHHMACGSSPHNPFLPLPVQPFNSSPSSQVSTPQPPASACQLPVSHTPTSSSHDVVGAGGEVPGKQEGLEDNSHPFAAPVAYDERGKHPRWQPLSYRNIKELCEAQRQFGSKSEFFRSTLKATFTSNTIVPSDLKCLFTCLSHDQNINYGKERGRDY